MNTFECHLNINFFQHLQLNMQLIFWRFEIDYKYFASLEMIGVSIISSWYDYFYLFFSIITMKIFFQKWVHRKNGTSSNITWPLHRKRNHFFIAYFKRMEITNIHFAIQNEIKIFPKRIRKRLTKNKAWHNRIFGSIL